MYGLINKALRDMVTEHHGPCIWGRILAESGVPPDSFLTMRSYDDDVTYDLAGATAQVMDAPVADCLKLFGQYWMTDTAPRHYGMLLDASGDTALEFLGNLNALHDRITTTFIDYRPPTFDVEPQDDGTALVDYISTREGLTPFVEGLLDGIALRFGTTIEVLSITPVPVDSGEHTRFHLRIGDAEL